MRSVTSFFNGTLFRKNMTRFWPIWVLYTVIWLFGMPIHLLLRVSRDWADRVESATYFANSTVLQLSGELGLFLAVTFGVCAAMAVFSYLYQSRSACMIHALPMRREGLFLTNFASGYCFFLLPNIAVFLLTLGAEAIAGVVNIGALCMWFAVVTLLTFFFYSFAVFCGMFTGQLVALPVFYGILNGLVLGVTYLLNEVLSSFVFGYVSIEGLNEFALWCTPVGKLASCLYVRANDPTANGMLDAYSFIGLQYVLFYAVIGALMAVAALLIYRKRHMEAAGDIVSVRAVRPIFKYGLAFCCALTFGLFLYNIFWGVAPEGAWTLLIFMMLCGAVGYFAAEMFLQKSFRVFGKWKGCVAFLLILAAGTAMMEFDLTGFEKRVPLPDKVQSVTVSGIESAPFDSGGHLNGTVRDPETIALVAQIHQKIVNKDFYGSGAEWQSYIDAEGSRSFFYPRLEYTLESGARVTRFYRALVLYSKNLGDPDSLESLIQRLLNRPDVIRAAYELDTADPAHINAVSVDVFDTQSKILKEVTVDSARDRQLVWQAVLADFSAGNLGRRFLFNDAARQSNTCRNDLSFEFLVPANERGYSYSNHKTVTLQDGATNTIAVLTSLGILDETHVLISNADFALQGGNVQEEDGEIYKDDMEYYGDTVTSELVTDS